MEEAKKTGLAVSPYMVRGSYNLPPNVALIESGEPAVPNPPL